MEVIHLQGAWRDADLGAMLGPPERRICLVRYGAIGDVFMLASTFPELREAGWHITVNVTERGAELLKSDPYVDRMFVQGSAQVPNDELDEYWRSLATHFERFVNLSESIEGALLLLPDRVVQNTTKGPVFQSAHPLYFAPQAERHAVCDVNYVERTHELVGVPFGRQDGRFYPTPDEELAARNARSELPRLAILWVLAGSSVHKVYPWMDHVIAQLLEDLDDVAFVLVGDDRCRMLEVGWENHPRVWCRAGEWGVRETLAFARQADMVIGPETGVLNAVAVEDVHKLVFLSHSSVENLTKHWRNTTALAARVPCHPCHRMHFGRKNCTVDEAHHVAVCSSYLPPQAVLGAILQRLQPEARAA